MLNPKLSHHARQRAAEMSVPTKVVKRAVREPEVRYCSKVPGVFICQAGDLAVAWCPATNTVLTVLPRTYQIYTRPGAS